jgi:hypothetical protein
MRVSALAEAEAAAAARVTSAAARRIVHRFILLLG